MDAYTRGSDAHLMTAGEIAQRLIGAEQHFEN